MKIDYEMKDGLIIKLKHRLDSANALETEIAINDILAEVQPKKIVVDLEELEYISSAGLRVLLKLIRQYRDLEIINVNLTCYEVFEMTGFTEMATIKKAYKKLNVEGNHIIGQGAKGIVYRYNDDTIVKVYKHAEDITDIEKERALAKAAFVLGVPTAISYDIVKVDGKFASVFELLDCHSLSELIAMNPSKASEYGKKAGELLKQINTTESTKEEIPSGKYKVERWFKNASNYLNDEEKEKVAHLLDNLDETKTLIHGDYHTKNIMVQGDEYILIDMDTLCYGNPVIELAIVDFSFNTVANYDKENAPTFLGISNEAAKEFYDALIDQYMAGKSEEEKQADLNKVLFLSNLRVLNFAFKNGSNKVMVEGALNEIRRLLNIVDNLNI